jgi:hypothetical protein
MSMLTYLPWCPIKEPFKVGEITLLPFNRGTRLNGLSDLAWSNICAILGVYRDINGNSIDRAAIVQFGSKSIVDDISEAEFEKIRDFIAIANCCALAQREFFGHGLTYCNADCFSAYTQKFDIAESLEFTTLVIRLRDRWIKSAWTLANISIAVPVQCHLVEKIAFNRALLSALLDHRENAKDRDWRRWQVAIEEFNRANTDGDHAHYRADWVALACAFEQLLAAKSHAADIAESLDRHFSPSTELMSSCSQRKIRNHQGSLRNAWMREFYKIRSGFAHGNLAQQGLDRWTIYEHLFLATLAFPLLMKSLLAQAQRYTLTEEDKIQIDCFEALADIPDFFAPPSDPLDDSDSHWGRLTSRRRREVSAERFRAQLRAGWDTQHDC